MTREAGQKTPPFFERGKLLKASQLNALAAAVSNIVLRGVQWFRPLNLRGYLLEDLYAANDSLTDPSTAQVRIVARNAAGNMALTSRIETVVNRFQNISVDADTFVGIEWVEGEWTIYLADCAPDSQSISSAGSDPAIASDPSLFPPGPGGGL